VLLLRNYAVDFVEICNVYIGKMIIKDAKRIFNSDEICRSYNDLNFGVTFLEHSVLMTMRYTNFIIIIIINVHVLFVYLCRKR